MENKLKKIITRNILSMSIAQVFSLIGSQIFSFVVGLYVLKVTGSGLNYAFTLILGLLPEIVIVPISGVISDKFDKKKIIIYTDLISSIALFVIWSVMMLNDVKLLHIYISTLIVSCLNAFATAPLQSSFPELVDNKHLTKINSLYQGITTIASIVGPGIGGALYAIFNIKVFILFNSITFLLATVLDCILDFSVSKKLDSDDQIKAKDNAEEEPAFGKGSFVSDFKEGFKYLKSQKWLMTIIYTAIVMNFMCVMSINIALPIIAVDIFGLSSASIGILQSIFPIGSIVATLIVYALPEKDIVYRRMITSIVIIGAGILSLGLFTLKGNQFDRKYVLGIMLGILIVLSFCSTFFNIPFMTLIQKRVSKNYLGRVNGLVIMFINLLTPVSMLMGGILIDMVNPGLIPLICGSMIIISIIIVPKKSIKNI